MGTVPGPLIFAGELGAQLDLPAVAPGADLDPRAACFAETPGRYLLEVRRADLPAVERTLARGSVHFTVIGELTDTAELHAADLRVPVETLKQAWRQPLDW